MLTNFVLYLQMIKLKIRRLWFRTNGYHILDYLNAGSLQINVGGEGSNPDY